MIAQLRSLLWLDYIMFALTDFKRLGMLLEKQRFLPATLLFPVTASLSDIICVYLIVKNSTTFFISVTYGFSVLSLVYILNSWISASLLTTGLDTRVDDNSVHRHFSLLNITYVFKLFVLPLVSIASVLSLAPAVFFILGQLSAVIVGIVCIAHCITTIYSVSLSRSTLSVIIPHILYTVMKLVIFIIFLVYFTQFVSV